MGAQVYNDFPNVKTVQFSTNTTSWTKVSSFPGLDPGMKVGAVVARSATSAGGDGDDFYIAFNRSAAPADETDAHLISSGGQQMSFSFVPWNVYVKKVTGTDVVMLSLYY